MYNKIKTLPIGKLLQAAGLISEHQLEQALLLQSEYTSMKLGEILVLQEVIKTQTVVFFVDKWEQTKQEGQQFPIGYYLTQASLLNEQQVKTILEEQKKKKLKFGDLVVQKGWLERNTINFFLDALSVQPPQLMSLIDLEKYDRKYLNLKDKYTDYSLILSRVLAWTGGNTILTKSICRVFASSSFNIPTGMEITAVDRFIEGSLIKNWQTTQLGTYIKSIKEDLLTNSKCQPLLLLKEYQSILLSGNKEDQATKEQKELLNLGLIVQDGKQLKVTNLIYQQIFNQDWLVKSINQLESPIQSEAIAHSASVASNPTGSQTNINQEALVNNAKIIKPNVTKKQKHKVLKEHNIQQRITPKKTTERQPNSNTEQKNLSPLTKFASLLTLAGFVLLVPFVIAISNYYSSLRQGEQQSLNSQSSASDLKQFCGEINLIDPPSSLNLIYQLETNKQEILSQDAKDIQQFPNNCETALNRLRVLAAPQLGRESRVIEAIKNICKIPADSDSLPEAGIWLEHWLNSDSWREQTKSYLKLIDNCPAKDLIS